MGFLTASDELALGRGINVVEYGFPVYISLESDEDSNKLISELGINDSEFAIVTMGRPVHPKCYSRLIMGFTQFVDLGFKSKLIFSSLKRGYHQRELMVHSADF